MAPKSKRKRARRRFQAATFSASATPPTSAIPASGSFASENTGFAGKRDGSFFALVTKSQLSYTYSQNLAFAFSAFNAYNRWSNVTVLQDALASAGAGVKVTGWDSFSSTAFRARSCCAWSRALPASLLAVTASMEPRWSRIDLGNGTGYPAQFYANEFKLFVDAALTERLFAAMNLIYVIATQKYDITDARWVDNSLTSVSGALTARVHTAEKALVEGVFLGVEGRLLSAFAGLFLNRKPRQRIFCGADPRHRLPERPDAELRLDAAAGRSRASCECAGTIGPGQLRTPPVPHQV